MKKTLFGIIVAVVVLVGGFYVLNSYIYNEKQGEGLPADYKDATYVIDGQTVKLTGGVSEVEAAPGSASKIITRYFGNEVKHDLNGDGREDVVFLLTQSTGGTGTFYYVVAALNKESGYEGSQALLLGDRIAPQTTELSRNPNHKNVIVVNYAERKPGESFTDQPSVGKSIWLKLDAESMQFGQVEQNFEGEADPSRMTLGMQSWTWVRTLMNNDTEITPGAGKTFSITFGTDGTFSAKTDCNSVGGSYTVKGTTITFGEMFATKMYCEGSQESEFTRMLGDSQSFHFTSKGELILDLKFDSGSVIFR